MNAADADKADPQDPSTRLLRQRRPLYLWTLLVLALALALNLVTARLSPRVWHDEVIFTDPAVNLVQGRGFTSSCWPCQRPDETFVGNLPLYPLLLAGWIRMLGFGIVSVRSLNYLLVSLAIFLVVVGAMRRGLLRSVGGSLLLSVGVLGGYWTSYSYRGGRYDMLGFALIAACWAVTSLARPRWGLATAFVLSILVPLAGIPHAIALFAIGGVILLFSRFREWRACLAVSAGALVGLAAYFGALYRSGLLPVFRKTLQTMMQRSAEWEGRISKLSHALTLDMSTQVLVGAACAMGLFAAVSRFEMRLRVLRWAAAALGFALLVPTAFIIAGRYPEYYAWTKHVPTLFCVIVAWETLWSQPRRWPRLVGSVVVLAVLVSASPLLLRLGFAFWSRAARDDQQANHAAEAHLTSTDNAFCSFAFYYPSRKIASQVYVPVSVEWMKPEDWQGLAAAILDPADEALFFEHQPRDRWRLIDELDRPPDPVGTPRYVFRIYRRSGN